MYAQATVKKASIHIFVAFDVGFEVRLHQIPVLFGDRRRDHLRHASTSRMSGRDTQPIRLMMDPVTLEMNGKKYVFDLYATFFDVGGLSLEFDRDMEESIHEWPALAEALMASKDLIEAARASAHRILEKAKPAVVKPELHPQPSMALVFNVEHMSEEISAAQITETWGTPLAQTLRASTMEIGVAETGRALNPFVTYSDYDLVFASQNVAIIFDDESDAELDVFEIANVQLLELTYLDARLDSVLGQLYEDSGAQKGFLKKIFQIFEAESRRLNTIHIDSTIIMERIDAGYKFGEDSHLVRIHDLCVNRMFLNNFSRSIDRKLKSIRDILNDQRERASSMRMEMLEWIIIILIAVEVVPFLIKVFWDKILS